MALRHLMMFMPLLTVVDTGLVVGTSAATTPRGLAKVASFSAGS